MPVKRQLSFDNLDQAIAEAERLLNSGYRQHGKWNLSQCCGHLQQWLSFSMDGFPNPGPWVAAALWLMKVTLGKRQLNSVLTNGFKPGLPTMPQTVPAAGDAAEADAVLSLKSTVERFKAHAGTIHPSPLYGRLDKPTATQLQLRHFEHHLGFLSPAE